MNALIYTDVRIADVTPLKPDNFSLQTSAALFIWILPSINLTHDETSKLFLPLQTDGFHS
jgi:hypothetical protein